MSLHLRQVCPVACRQRFSKRCASVRLVVEVSCNQDRSALKGSCISENLPDALLVGSLRGSNA